MAISSQKQVRGSFQFLLAGFFEQSNCWCHFWCHFFEAIDGCAILNKGVQFDVCADRKPAPDL
ncbi:MAG: hypothetical protein DSZ35_06910 [Verrucomicrobia bacterium]|nr:MAG: hypothetical protein DSZ35_06910 [Verrucomicrobiota bacterium]